jgi:hypothetical protein
MGTVAAGCGADEDGGSGDADFFAGRTPLLVPYLTKHRGELQVAYDQGELNLAGETTPSYIENIKPLVEAGKATPLFTLGQIEGPDLVRDPAFPDLPHIGEVHESLYGKPADGPGLQWNAYKLQVAAALTVSKSLWVRADAPQEARDALVAAATDPQAIDWLRADVKTRYGLDLE